MAKPLSRRPADAAERDWPEWHDETIHALDRLNSRLQRFGLLLVVALLAVGYFALKATINQGHTADTANRLAAQANRLAVSNHQLAVQNHQLTLAIQQSRYRGFLDSCRETNHRHDATLGAISRQIGRLHGRRRMEARLNSRGVVFIIDAFEPKMANCKAFAASRVKLP